jgi:hypothetical protein
LLASRILLSLGEAFSNGLPVDDLPNGLQILGASVLVLKVVSVFPNIHTEKRNEAQERILVLGASNLQTLGRLVIALYIAIYEYVSGGRQTSVSVSKISTHQPRPTGAWKNNTQENH